MKAFIGRTYFGISDIICEDAKYDLDFSRGHFRRGGRYSRNKKSKCPRTVILNEPHVVQADVLIIFLKVNEEDFS